MSWERRLRDMVLAGGTGALAAVGCGNGSAPPGVNFCCNANSDPCCRSTYCGEMVTPQCTAKMACESDGGTWDYGAQGCARVQDAGPDAPADAVTYADVGAVTFCCNANSDPCCPSLYCGATVTPLCTEKMACESDGGTWDYENQGCAPDAGPSDAGTDGHGQGD